MSSALGDSAAYFKCFHGIWVVNKTRGWATTARHQPPWNPVTKYRLAAVWELCAGKLRKRLCLMGYSLQTQNELVA